MGIIVVDAGSNLTKVGRGGGLAWRGSSGTDVKTFTTAFGATILSPVSLVRIHTEAQFRCQ